MALKYNEPRKKTEYIVIHHFGVLVDYWGNEKKEEQAVWNAFKKHPEYTYHYVILSTGKIINLNKEEVVVYNANNNMVNDTSIAVCLFGDFRSQKPSKNQIEVLQALLKKLVEKYNIKKENIKGHKDVGDAYTECPGDNLYNLLPKIKEVIYMSDWKKEVLNWAVQKGLIQNPEVHKNLDEPFTKAQVLAILKNLIERLKIDIGG